MEQLIEALKITIEDQVLITSEKHQLKSLLKDESINKREADFLRSKIYEIAESKINDQNYLSILRWIEDTNKIVLGAETKKSDTESVFFSPGEDCLQIILHEIKHAQKSIKVCLFTISDDRISNALISAFKKGVSVKVITDNDKLFDQGSDVEKLAESNIPIKIDYTEKHMHHKFAVFDSKTTLTGSYNWTRSAAQYNHENVLKTSSNTVYTSFNREFDRLWNELVTYE